MKIAPGEPTAPPPFEPTAPPPLDVPTYDAEPTVGGFSAGWYDIFGLTICGKRVTAS
eukprot:SAG31_NODE_21638_length_544_cov_1.417978_1_plen_56_part_01